MLLWGKRWILIMLEVNEASLHQQDDQKWNSKDDEHYKDE